MKFFFNTILLYFVFCVVGIFVYFFHYFVTLIFVKHFEVMWNEMNCSTMYYAVLYVIVIPSLICVSYTYEIWNRYCNWLVLWGCARRLSCPVFSSLVPTLISSSSHHIPIYLEYWLSCHFVKHFWKSWFIYFSEVLVCCLLLLCNYYSIKMIRFN